MPTTQPRYLTGHYVFSPSGKLVIPAGVLEDLDLSDGRFILPVGVAFPSSNNTEGRVVWRADSPNIGLYIYSGGSYLPISGGGGSGPTEQDDRYARRHVHIQASPAMQWDIEHFFATSDILFAVWDNSVPPSPIGGVPGLALDENNYRLEFSAAIAGKAILFGVSDPI